MAVDANVFEFSALEAGFMVIGVVMSEGCIIVAASPPNFCASDSGFSSWVRENDEAEGVEFLEAVAASSMRFWVEASSFRY